MIEKNDYVVKLTSADRQLLILMELKGQVGSRVLFDLCSTIGLSMLNNTDWCRFKIKIEN
ncbi:hypothetical protein [Peribacillus sp. TH16]|uniref:hypothetical protein n=1 Tax=Peribacillus sp. TH16 TaxID=2798482 RepID=UPI001A9295AC|nr:hypothetical protein [Peribacillus sp. TH16]